MIGGIAIQRTRASGRRPKQRRQYRGALRDGELVCERGAWVVTIAKDGTPSEPVRDASRRLNANIGDLVLVIGDDVAAMRIVGIVAAGWGERWRVETVAGHCADGRALVMSARGLEPRRSAIPRSRSLRTAIAERAREVSGRSFEYKATGVPPGEGTNATPRVRAGTRGS